MKNFLRLASSIPDGQKPPGIHPDWPMTRLCFNDNDPDPDEVGLVGPLTDQEVDTYIENERAAYEAANAANAAAQQAWYDAAVLPDMKAAAFARIDERTQQLIAEGFEFSSKRFSMSIEAQIRLLGAFNSRASLTYPIVWNTLDDLDTQLIEDSNDIESMYATAVETLRTIVDSGTTLKDDVRGATSVAELNAIVDER